MITPLDETPKTAAGAGNGPAAWYRVAPVAMPMVSASQRLLQLKAEGLRTLENLALPSAGDEEWKYTSLTQLSRVPYRPASTVYAKAALTERVKTLLLHDLGNISAVFVNGLFSRELSSTGNLPEGLEFGSLAEAASGAGSQSRVSSGESDLVSSLSSAGHFFLAFNAAHCRDVLDIRVKKGVNLREPIQLIFLSTDEGVPTFSCPRVRILAEEASTIFVVESYSSVGNAQVLTVPVTELTIGPAASVSLAKLVLESTNTTHISTLGISQERGSRLNQHIFNFGGGVVRNELRPVLNGEGCETLLNGLTVVGGTQHVDNHLVIDHAQPNCFSREVFKGIYAAQSTGIFSGTIIVRPDAQKTNAVQSNRSLLLSPEASVNTRPQLKIFADDVKCTHGATIGQLDESALFYLRARGIREDEARTILIHAFADDVIESVTDETLAARLREHLETAFELQL